MQNIIPYKDSTNPNNGLPVKGHYVIDSSVDFYSDIWQRIPVMFGFNFPTFRLLDYLSCELEWYGCSYSPSLYDLEGFKYLLPLPDGSSYTGSP